MPKTTKRIINVLTAFKGVIVVAGSLAYVTEHEHVTFWVLVSGAALDESIKFFQKELKIKLDENNQPKRTDRP